MSETPESSHGRTDRRTFLGLLGIAGVGALPAVQAEQDESSYVIEQDGECIPVVPLQGDEPVEEFYDYRNPYTEPSSYSYSSHGTTDLQESDTSILFLYEGPNGLSLVLVHDKYEDETDGGSLTFEIDGLPEDGQWVVQDDEYDGDSNYDRWEIKPTSATIDWTWKESRADGGVFYGLGEEFAIEVSPGFNQGAALYGAHSDGTLSDWQVLSGDRDNPDRTSLALDEPITIRTGSCGDEIEQIETPTQTEVETETEVEVELDVRPGDRPVVNPNSRGRLPVAVYSSDSFDATTIDPETVRFGPAGASPVHATVTDVNADGRADLVFHFRVPDTGITADTSRVGLKGETTTGVNVHGTADISIVPGRADETEEEYETEPDEWSEKREKEEEKREEKREKTEEKREKAEEKREQAEEKREEKREKAEEKREKRREKEEKKREKKREKEEETPKKEEENREMEDEEQEESDETEDGDGDDDDDGDDSLISIDFSFGG